MSDYEPLRFKVSYDKEGIYQDIIGELVKIYAVTDKELQLIVNKCSCSPHVKLDRVKK